MVKVRFWQQSDLPELMRMAGVTAWNITPPDDKPHTRFENVAANAQQNLMRVLSAPYGMAVVAEENGQVVGYLLLAVQQNDKTGEPHGYAADIYVEPGNRRGGASRQLHALGEAYLRHLGLQKLTNWTHAHNPLGQKASEKHGFRLHMLMMSKDLRSAVR
ncbi:MAG: putative acetyltransferase [Symbiobacteriaceae bacterium]|jgi:GNAT superfamily N-acetyltransferase|nr:putative acetyltransferase [Symbiobacteriaceae bacterium]